MVKLCNYIQFTICISVVLRFLKIFPRIKIMLRLTAVTFVILKPFVDTLFVHKKTNKIQIPG